MICLRNTIWLESVKTYIFVLFLHTFCLGYLKEPTDYRHQIFYEKKFTSTKCFIIKIIPICDMIWLFIIINSLLTVAFE